MPEFLFDTDHLTLYQHKHSTLVHQIAARRADAVAICPINIEEVMRGRLAPLARLVSGAKHVRAYQELAAAEAMLRLFPVVPFDNNSEIQYRSLRSIQVRIGSLDLKIAAIALTHGLTVLTRNRRDFERVPGLLIEDWSV